MRQGRASRGTRAAPRRPSRPPRETDDGSAGEARREGRRAERHVSAAGADRRRRRPTRLPRRRGPGRRGGWPEHGVAAGRPLVRPPEGVSVPSPPAGTWFRPCRRGGRPKSALYTSPTRYPTHLSSRNTRRKSRLSGGCSESPRTTTLREGNETKSGPGGPGHSETLVEERKDIPIGLITFNGVELRSGHKLVINYFSITLSRLNLTDRLSRSLLNRTQQKWHLCLRPRTTNHTSHSLTDCL